MSPDQGVFQDPLLGGIQRILGDRSGVSRTLLLAQLATEFQKTRSRGKAGRFSREEDPLLTSFRRVIQEAGVQLRWEKLIYLGCSAGGDVALRTLFRYISFPHLPIVIVMHHNPNFRFLARLELVNGLSQHPVVITEDMGIKSAEIYFVPGNNWVGYHSGSLAFRLSPITHKTRFRPVIDTVFRTAAEHFGNRTVGVILSGMMDDGAQGLHDIFLKRGKVMVQEPSSSTFDDMPRAAQAMVPTAAVLTLKEIAERINTYSREFIRPHIINPLASARASWAPSS